MTKQLAIQNAYGRFYDKKFIRNDGSMSETIWKHLGVDLEYDDYSTGYFRPKSLQGIENNNGWIKIESEADLPNLKDELLIFRTASGLTTTWQSEDILDTPKFYLRYSHYKIKEKDLPPLY